MAMMNQSGRKTCQDQVRAEAEASTTARMSEYFDTPHSSTVVQNEAGSQDSTTNSKSDSFPSVYYSTRIESMMESRSKLGSGLEFEIEASKEHWTEVDHSTSDMGSSSSDFSESSVTETDREYFEMLKQHPQWGNFFKEFPDLVIGEKIAEGGQAEIYAASFKNKRRYQNRCKSMEGGCDDYLEVHNVEKLKDGRRFLYVVKVFKGANIPLRFLQSQWPRGMLSAGHSRDGPLVSIIGGTLLKDKRLENKFAFVMSRRKGDLRRLIDARMVENGNKSAPFSEVQTKWLMYKIAKDMSQLHEEYGILHKDLKAANVLLSLLEDDKDLGIGDEVCVVVADFECSMGVVGTGFWRAPEILRQLKNRGLSSKVEFTPQADVYCYGMTCYEIVTGCIPFGDQSFNKYDLVLSGRRPELPSGLDPFIKEIIVSCWKDDPLLRPSFQEIVKKLHSRLYESEDVYP